MSAQNLLTTLLDAIAVLFITIATIDFIGGLMPRRSQNPTISPGQLSLFDIKPEPLAQPRTKLDPLSQLPDPWMLPTGDVFKSTVLPQKPAQPEQKPLLLLPQAKEIEISRSSPLPVIAELTLDVLAGINIDTLQLRPARKIAKTLGIAQKVNGKDLPLSWLRAQIKSKLQGPELLPEVIQVVRDVLAS